MLKRLWPLLILGLFFGCSSDPLPNKPIDEGLNIQASSFTSTLIAKHSSLCMSVRSGSLNNYAPIEQATCTNADSQKFTFDPVAGKTNIYTLTNVNSGRCMWVDAQTYSYGTPFSSLSCQGRLDQQFELVAAPEVSGGYYQLKVQDSGKCATVSDASTSSGTRVVEETCQSASMRGQQGNQLWKIATSTSTNIRYTYKTDRSNPLTLQGAQNILPFSCISYDGTVPSGGQVKFYLDNTLYSTENLGPYDMGGGDATCNKVTIAGGSHTVKVLVNGVDSGSATFTVSNNLPAPGTKLTNITSCLGGVSGAGTSLPGNISTPASLGADGEASITFMANLSGSTRPVLTRFANGSCAPYKILKDVAPSVGSHDAPSVFGDKLGKIISTYYGAYINDNEPAGTAKPFMRVSTQANNVITLGSEGRTRLQHTSETHGFRLQDGGLLLGTSAGEFDIREPDGTWRTSELQRVVRDENYAAGSPHCPDQGHNYLNRFKKTVFHQGVDGNLYVIWGYASGWHADDTDKPPSLCSDLRHYDEDDHELFFAYSSNGGATWKNATGTVELPVGTCTASGVCSGGIPHYKEEFRITDVRQGEHRKIWVTGDGTVHITFVQSSWCYSSACIQSAPGSTDSRWDPGALMYLKFKLGETPGQPVKVEPVNADTFFYVAGIREQDGNVYIWALDKDTNKIAEFMSSNGTTFSRTDVAGIPWCNRLHGDVSAPEYRSILLVAQCNDGNPRQVFLYRRDF